jgi:uncharacterized protein YfdQ (DUF2303 family)
MDIRNIIDALKDLFFDDPSKRFVSPSKDAPPLAILTNAQGAEEIIFPQAALDWHEKREQRLAPGPRRREGTTIHTESSSFIACVERNKNENSTIWADLENVRLLAVFDYHPAGGDATKAAWCKHKAVYTCPRSKGWIAWCQMDGKNMSQEQFSDFIEEHLDDLTSGKPDQGFPKPAAVLELARDLKVHMTGMFERKINPTTGESSLVCKQENDQSSTPIPKSFLLKLAIFEGGELYGVEAKIRMKVQGGQAVFHYILHLRSELERAAFDDVRALVAEKTALPVFSGTPES